MVLAVLLIAVQRATLRALIQFSKNLLGDHWRLVLIPAMLTVELGPALLLARIETLGDLEFWGTFCLAGALLNSLPAAQAAMEFELPHRWTDEKWLHPLSRIFSDVTAFSKASRELTRGRGQ